MDIHDIHMICSQLNAAPRGARTKVAQATADSLGINLATLYARIATARCGAERKRRADRGACMLSRDDAMMICAVVEGTRRDTGTGALPVSEAVEILRANGRIKAERLDRSTGELVPLSISAINRALRAYGFAADQLAKDTRAVQIATTHPNQMWQIDASVSRQFFLAEDGAQIMPKREFYRGKPGNFAAINDRRIWRYVVTDHCSGAIEVKYVQSAESAANVLLTLIYVMTQRDDGTMYGVPKSLVADLGSGNTATPVRNFCRALGLDLVFTAAGNPRAKGQVEQAQNMVERLFEAGLKMRAPVTSIDHINQLAQSWCRVFNATRIHSRTKMTRRDCWLRIRSDQLVLAPSVDVLRAIANTAPVKARVRNGLVRAFGQRWDVRAMPGCIDGQSIELVRNALDEQSVRVLVPDHEVHGRFSHYIAPVLVVDGFGFSDIAVPFGEFRAMAQTPAEARAVEIDKLITGEETRDARAAARSRRRVPFDGAIDPTAAWRAVDVPAALPRAATASSVSAPEVIAPFAARISLRNYDSPPLAGVAMIRRIKSELETRGGTWNAELFQECELRWPDGVAEERIEQCAQTLMRPKLAAVQGA